MVTKNGQSLTTSFKNVGSRDIRVTQKKLSR